MSNFYQQKFSIRKYSFGAASVLIAFTLLASGTVVKADEQTTPASDISSEVVVLSPNSEPDLETTAVADQTNQTNLDQNQPVVTTQNLSTVEVQGQSQSNETSTHLQVSEAEVEAPANSVQSDSVSASPVTVTTTSPRKTSLEVSTNSLVTNIPNANLSRMLGVSKVAVNNGVIGDDYPAHWKNPVEQIDSWGYISATCTSFVANRLHNVNKFEMPRAIGNAGDWGASARRLGYRVDKTPAIGSVAYVEDASYGHVAWVAAINGNYVTVEEYNWNWDYSYHTRTKPISAFTGFIHFKDLSSTPTTPTSSSGSSALAESGTYYFTSRKPIKNEARISSGDIGYYDSGDSVNYDSKLKTDGYEWISYISYSGARRYIPIKQLSSSSVQPKGTVTVSAYNKGSNSFDVTISNIVSNGELSQVQVPVWTTTKGQDDIVWYKAQRQNDGSYKATVNLSDHGNAFGEYNIHLYYVTTDGKQVGVSANTYTISSNQSASQTPRGKIGITYQTDGFVVTISGASDANGIARVNVPVWTESNGQDDIVWYQANKNSDGTYSVKVNYASHNNERGLYNIHLYYVENNGQQVGVSTTTASPSASTQSRPLIADSGTYVFSGNAIIRNEPNLNSPEIARYGAGNSVNYDKVIYANGHYWISYVSYSGSRRYINIT